MQFGNVVPAVAVTFAAPASGPSATFGGAATVNTGSDGIATSPILTANATAGAFNVTATAAGASSATFSLTNLPAVPKFITFIQQPPPSTAAGSAMTPPIIVQVKDEFQTPLPGVQVAMLLQGPSEDLTGTTTRFTAANGLATFNDLSITQAGANYQLDAVAIGSSAEALSNSFTITGGAPAAISILSGGTQSATILTPYAIPLTVIVEDQFLNPVSGATVVFTAPPSGASGLFSGSTTANVVTDAEGQAAAPITANGTAGAFTVTAGVGAFSVPFQLTNTRRVPGQDRLLPAAACNGYSRSHNYPAGPGEVRGRQRQWRPWCRGNPHARFNEAAIGARHSDHGRGRLRDIWDSDHQYRRHVCIGSRGRRRQRPEQYRYGDSRVRRADDGSRRQRANFDCSHVVPPA